MSPAVSTDREHRRAVTAATFTVLSYNVDGLPAILQDGGHPEVTTPIIGQNIYAPVP